MKILFKTSGKKPTKNITSQRAYPHGIEMKFYRQLKAYFKPLTDYVNKYINEHLEPLLRGDDKEIKLDAIPGESYRNMIYSLENWLSIYMPDISNTPESANNNVIFLGLGKTADEAMEFSEKEFKKIIDKGIHVNVPTSAPWWEDMKSSWAEDNYTLITSNARKYVEQINILTEQSIVNGLSPGKLKEEIMKATQGLSDRHCKLLARDQMGKLNGQITQAQMQEIGLDLYVWSTSYDDRVRDSHALMEGLLCRWDDASVCSYDNGKTWEPRPSGAVDLHPGQDIQCRCVGLAFYPELEAEMEGITLGEATEGLPDVQDLPQFEEGKLANLPEYARDNIEALMKEFNYVGAPEGDISDILAELKKSGGINPHYVNSFFGDKGYLKYQYTENCQRCVPTLQMKLKGFDVTALPRPAKTPPLGDLTYGDSWFDWLRDKKGNPVKPTNIFEEYFKTSSTNLLSPKKLNGDDLRNATIEYMKQFPKGSMFEIKCHWKNGGGHVFAGFSYGDEGVIFYDPQQNIFGLNKWFDDMEIDSLDIIRTDDKIMNIDRIKQACKNN